MRPSEMIPSAVDREAFAIARQKARSASELERIERLHDMLLELAAAEDVALDQRLANQRARGEPGRPLTAAEEEFLRDFEVAPEEDVDALVRSELLREPDARHVLRCVVYGAMMHIHARRDTLGYFAEDDRPIEEALIERYRAFADALFDFIDDNGYRTEVARFLARDRLARNGAGTAVFLVLDAASDGEPELDGKSLGRAFEKLESAAASLGVRPLSEFFGFGGRGSGDWFDPAEGLTTVRALIEHVRGPATKIKAKKALLADLRDAESILAHAREAGARFHVEVDI
jgi:hypothetical protein